MPKAEKQKNPYKDWKGVTDEYKKYYKKKLLKEAKEGGYNPKDKTDYLDPNNWVEKKSQAQWNYIKAHKFDTDPPEIFFKELQRINYNPNVRRDLSRTSENELLNEYEEETGKDPLKEDPEPKAAEPKAAEPKAAEPKAAEPKAAPKASKTSTVKKVLAGAAIAGSAGLLAKKLLKRKVSRIDEKKAEKYKVIKRPERRDSFGFTGYNEKQLGKRSRTDRKSLALIKKKKMN
jgi:hypothetical protein